MSPVSPEPVKIIECPRDAWQGMAQQIPAEVKADYLRALGAAGFQHIDAVSFVSPSAVPQMADSEQVLALLGPGFGAEIIGIVVNEQGAERAIATEAVRTLGFPYSISATFLERNQRQTPQAARQTLEKISARAERAGLGVVAYLSMAFGNPYGDPWRPEDVMAACLTLKEMGMKEISLADTVGLASPEQVRSLVSGVLAEYHRHRARAPPARPPGTGRERKSQRLTRRAAPPGHGAGRPGRLSFCTGRTGGKCSDRGSHRRTEQAGRGTTTLAATGRIAGDEPSHRG